MDLRIQRRIAADLLKCGIHRVWMDPERMEDISEAVTRDDIRILIKMGAIRKMQVKGVSRGRHRKMADQRKKGRRKGQGSRKGTHKARMPKKRRWIQTIRPIRAELKRLRDEGIIDRSEYRRYYMLAKGGMYRSKAHMLSHMKSEGLLKRRK